MNMFKSDLKAFHGLNSFKEFDLITLTLLTKYQFNSPFCFHSAFDHHQSWLCLFSCLNSLFTRGEAAGTFSAGFRTCGFNQSCTLMRADRTQSLPPSLVFVFSQLYSTLSVSHTHTHAARHSSSRSEARYLIYSVEVKEDALGPFAAEGQGTATSYKVVRWKPTCTRPFMHWP